MCCLSCMYGMVTNLQVLSFNSSCLDLQSNCVNLQEHLQVRRSCTNKLFLLSEQGAQWLQGKQKGRDRVLSYKDIERILQKGQTDTHATPNPTLNKISLKSQYVHLFTQKTGFVAHLMFQLVDKSTDSGILMPFGPCIMQAVSLLSRSSICFPIFFNDPTLPPLISNVLPQQSVSAGTQILSLLRVKMVISLSLSKAFMNWV